MPANTPYPQVLDAIAMCESGATQYTSNGGILHGTKHPADTGYFQINKDVWGSTADKMGINLDNPKQNIEFAIWLFERFGTQPWNSSKSCWVDYADKLNYNE